MGTESRAWEWEKAEKGPWLRPTEDAYYYAADWKRRGMTRVLDLGTGLGRHAVFFAQNGFEVKAVDLSAYGVEHARSWAAHEGVRVEARVGDMVALPYADGEFDCVFAFHVISHTDAMGVKRIMDEVARVLRPGGEFFFTLCAKESENFRDKGFERIDGNTVRLREDGPEDGVPHYFADMTDIVGLCEKFAIRKVRHVHYGYRFFKPEMSWHYYVLGVRVEDGADPRALDEVERI